MKRYWKLIVFAAIIALVLVLDHIYGWSDYLRDGDGLALLRAAVREDLLRAAALYCLLTVVGCVVLSLPGVTFAVIAGVLFGPWLGTALCLIATTLGAIAAFLAGRFFLKDAIEPLVRKNALLDRLLFEDAGRSDIVLLMITRLVPLFPYNLQNFAYGVTDISLGAYSLYTFLFMIPGVALFTVGSVGLTAGSGRWGYLAAAAVLLVLVVVLAWAVKRRYLDRPEKEKRGARHAQSGHFIRPGPGARSDEDPADALPHGGGVRGAAQLLHPGYVRYLRRDRRGRAGVLHAGGAPGHAGAPAGARRASGGSAGGRPGPSDGRGLPGGVRPGL